MSGALAAALADALRSVGLDAASAEVGLEPGPPRPFLPSPLRVDELACACVAAALVAAAELANARGLGRPAVSLDAAHVAVAFRSERYARVRGRDVGPAFDPLSSFMAAADGWVRTHGNYPHHAAALRRALGVDGSAGASAVRAAVAARPARDVEDAVVAAGGCAAAVREEGAWPLAPGPLVAWERGASVSVRRADPHDRSSTRPAAGVRVLDLTRVIAGPVGTRFLAALGADVLRIDPPWLPELPLTEVEGVLGKRSAFVDLRTADGRARLERLLAEADVLVHGYRPGALAAVGLGADALRERHPHLVTVTLSAWGEDEPWAGRRGFDSLVQAASGIALACAADDGTPGALPAQALDHGTGYLIAAAALRALADRERDGRVCHARLALAHTAQWLLSMPRHATAPQQAPELDARRYLTTIGDATLVAPPGRLDGRPLAWTRAPAALGADAPTWAA